MGSMYAFPRVYLPDKAKQAAKSEGMTPDNFYCLALLKETGICTYPGCSFGEEPETHHFRITILPQVFKFHTILLHSSLHPSLCIYLYLSVCLSVCRSLSLREHGIVLQFWAWCIILVLASVWKGGVLRLWNTTLLPFFWEEIKN